MAQTRKRKRKGDAAPGKMMNAGPAANAGPAGHSGHLSHHHQSQQQQTITSHLNSSSPTLGNSYGGPIAMMMGGNGGKMSYHHQQDANSPIHHNELIKTEHSVLNGNLYLYLFGREGGNAPYILWKIVTFHARFRLLIRRPMNLSDKMGFKLLSVCFLVWITRSILSFEKISGSSTSILMAISLICFVF